MFGLNYNGLFLIPMKTFWVTWQSRILTRIRAELRNDGEEDRIIADEIE